MNYSNFEAKVSFWPHMHFTEIEMEHCGDFYEIYANDVGRLSKSKLFLGRTPDHKLAEVYCKQFEEWLPKVNRALRMRAVEPLSSENTSQRFIAKSQLEMLPGQIDSARNRNHW
jgi:hypothetical protein